MVEITFKISNEYTKPESVEVARKLLEHLIQNPGRTIYYGELVSKLDKSLYGYTAQNVERLLGDISFACKENGLPPISAIVINKEDNRPGAGFFKAYYPGLKSDEQEIKWIEICKEVFAYQNWNAVLEAYNNI